MEFVASSVLVVAGREIVVVPSVSVDAGAENVAANVMIVAGLLTYLPMEYVVSVSSEPVLTPTVLTSISSVKPLMDSVKGMNSVGNAV